MVKQTYQDMKNHIITFVDKTLDKEVPNKKCFTMCYILSVYLDIRDIPHTIKRGRIRPATKKEDITHYIITFKDNEDTVVIDPTVQQIVPTYPQKILIEKMQKPYLPFNEINFDEAYKDWDFLLHHDGIIKQHYVEDSPYPIPEKFKKNIENTKIDLIPYIRILLRAYSVFKEEIIELERKRQRFQSRTVNSFFELVKKVIIKNEDKRGKLDDSSLNSKFDELLT